MENKMYILRNRENKELVGYASIEDITAVVPLNNENKLEVILSSNKTIEDAIFKNKNKYELLKEMDIVENSPIYNKVILKNKEIHAYFQNNEIMNSNRHFGRYSKNLFKNNNSNN